MRQGFTLIELSITLIIIGLIVGGVLVGRDLIRNAEVRAQVRQIESYNTAVNTFKTKYTCLPGDCAFAIQLGLGTTNGNGNGRFDRAPSSPACLGGQESIDFWQHLNAAQLIDWSGPANNIPGINSPPLKLKGRGDPASPSFYNRNPLGGIWITSDSIFSPFRLGSASWFLTDFVDHPTGACNANIVSGIYHPSDAYALDVKIDDGLPASGSMRNVLKCVTHVCIGSPLVCTCTLYDTTTITCGQNGVYNILNPSTMPPNLCAPMIRSTF